MSEIENPSFEEAFAELEEVVQQLEAGDLALDQAMALFERGMTLATQCNAQLDAAELRVQQLVGEGDALTPFGESSPDEDA